MNIELTDGFLLTADATNYELHHGSITYYYRNITDALDRYLELVRKDRTQKYDGNIDKYVEEIKKVNMETTKRFEELIGSGVINGKE